jgi:hypothetical protein
MMLKRIPSPMLLVAMLLIAVIWEISFFVYVMPTVYPLLLQGRFWAGWVVMGVFIGPLALLMVYVSMEATNFQSREWKPAIIGIILSYIYLTGLAFIFSNILPSDFEPFRSIVLPVVVLAATFVVLSKTVYAKRARQY